MVLASVFFLLLLLLPVFFLVTSKQADFSSLSEGSLCSRDHNSRETIFQVDAKYKKKFDRE